MSNLLFKKVEYSVGKIIEDIDIGEIGLPDIQRPFVWDNTRVRDLFDSMYRGFPVGTLLFWENGFPGEHRTIGVEQKQKAPKLLIVDGQQRLTALYAVIKGVPIVDKNYKKRYLRIAFNPIEEKFEVTNASIEKNPLWIADISELWKTKNTYSFINRYIEKLKLRTNVGEEVIERVPESIQRLVNLINYPLTALEISFNAREEQVSEIFVRINSKGRTLNQADFILTLMSVFWEEGRKELEKFAEATKKPPADNTASPYNPYFQPLPDQLLRVDVALAFRRARLEHVYSILRGKDLNTGEFSEERRDKQFAVLKEAQSYVLNLQNWHDFIDVLKKAGFIHPKLIISDMAVLYTYALWLIGKRDFHVEHHQLRRLIARWFFMSTLTQRYTGSPEGRMEQDLGLLRGSSSQDFVDALEREIKAVLTNDFWRVTLPNELASAGGRTPAQSAYIASLCLLGAPVLYSRMKVSEMLDPYRRAKKEALERHHLFPRGYLKKTGINRDKDINQVANFALVEWKDNIDISDEPPEKYAPKYEQQFSDEEIKKTYYYHGLPEGWYKMDYMDFLEERRKRMAEIIRAGFESIK